MFSPEIAVIINSFNRFSLLQKCLTSLIENLNAGFKEKFVIVVFEAGSKDGSYEYIENIKNNQFPHIDILTPGTNGDSFSAGINDASFFAIKKYSASLRYLFAYETDNFLQGHKAFKNACDLLQAKPDIGACGFSVKKHDGRSASPGCPFPSTTSFVIGQQLTAYLKLNETKPVWIKQGDFEYA